MYDIPSATQFTQFLLLFLLLLRHLALTKSSSYAVFVLLLLSCSRMEMLTKNCISKGRDNIVKRPI